MIYVGRAEHEGGMFVCKVVPTKQIGFVSNRGEALPKDVFEMLCGQNLAWVKCYDHVIPETAVLCGRTSLDQPVYIGRGHYEGHLIIGKISSVHRALFIAFRGAERRLDSYEILVEEKSGIPGWQLPPTDEDREKCSLSPPPPPSPPAPVAEKAEKAYRYPYPLDIAMPMPMHDRPPMYTPTAQTPQAIVPQPIIVVAAPTPLAAPQPLPPPPPPATPPYTPILEVRAAPLGAMQPAATYIPPSVAPSFTPADTYKPPMPSCSSFTPAEYAPYGAAPSYVTSVPPIQHMPPTHHDGFDNWMSASFSYMPPDAVIAGHDTDMSPLFVCRGYFDGTRIPGKAVPGRGGYIGHAGREIMESNYEVLIGQNKYHWVPAYNGDVPPGAVQGGRTRIGDPLYVGRAHYAGSLTPGKVHPSYGCLIPFGGTERCLSSYEVLVRSDYYHRQQAILLTY